MHCSIAKYKIPGKKRLLKYNSQLLLRKSFNEERVQ